MKRLSRQMIYFQKTKQSGAVLLLAMVFLLLLAMIAGTVMQTSIMELQMAGNDQFREEAFQKAQAVAAAISEDPANFPVSGAVGHTICESESCGTTRDFMLSADIEGVPTGVILTFEVERQGPLFLETLPFRLAEGSASSSLAYDAAVFEASVKIDGSDANLGTARVVQGVAIVVASSSQ